MADINVMTALEAKVTELGTARAAARHFNIPESYLSQIRNGHKPLPEWMGIALGFMKVWQRMEDSSEK